MLAVEADPTLIELTAQDTFEPVERMLRAMYEQLAAFGQSMPLAPGGEKTWLRGVVPTLGRNSVLFMAKLGDAPVGFSHGSLRLPPSHLAPQKIGFVSHLYVAPEARGRAVGRRLAQALESWLRERGVVAIELHVVQDNDPARSFWTALGYTPDLVQLRKLTPSTTTDEPGHARQG